ncbi:MAG: undecaprenyl-diphosphate phosphatase [Candidatus Omnitrophota bacterium]
MLYAVLGIIQGLTEFLPVSSSGHLALFSLIFNIRESQVLPIIIICHIGTLFAVFSFFARDIWRILKDLVILGQIFVVTLITLIFALIGKNFFERLFREPVFICLALFITAVFLLSTRGIKKGRRDLFALNFRDAFWLGISQGFAIIPGISRSGITIFSLLARGMAPEVAFKFSFIAGIPAILGSFFWEAKNIALVFNHHPLDFWLTLIISYIVGLFSLLILRRVVKKLQLHYFGYYLVLISILGFILTRT